MSNKVVIIPTYNEIENIRNIITAVINLKESFDVLVVDDNSPDGTAAEVESMMAEYPERIAIIKRAGKLGLGTAYIEGFKWALDQGYQYMIEMDADFSHKPADLPRLYQACSTGGADVAVGSRYCKGISVVYWPLSRVLMSYYASTYVRLVTGLDVRDTTAGFVCYRAEVLRTMDLDRIHFKGYAFQIEMKYTAVLCGFNVVEVPIIFINRELGVSKMNTSIFGEALFGVLKLRYWAMTKNYPQKGRRSLPEGKGEEV